MADKNQKDEQKVPDACSHCGNKLSAWQQVLLKVDRALVCKNCWYRIILEPPSESKEESNQNTDKLNNQAK